MAVKASLQRLRRLSRRRSARTEEGAYVLDGSTLLGEALDAGVALIEVVAEPNCPDDLLARAEAAGAAITPVSSGALARAVDTVTPQPVAAIAALPELALDAALDGIGGDHVPLVLVLVGINDPGNAGTLLRSADAAGAQVVVFCDDAVDPYNPKCVRAAAGSLFRLGVVRSAAAEEVVATLGARGVQAVGTAVDRGTAYDAIDWTGPSAILLGNEAHGLDPDVAAGLEKLATIPMAGPVESLNVGMAGTLICFEALRQRRSANRLDGAGAPKAG